MKIKSIITLFLSLFTIVSIAQTDWKKLTTVEEVCAAYPEQINFIFQNLNLEYTGLEEVKKAYLSNNLSLAGRHLLAYYAKSKRVLPRPKLPPNSLKTRLDADSIVKDVFTFQEVKGKAPRLPDGHLKWAYTGPENDFEWAWALNRHYPVRDLVDAYLETGNLQYLQYVDSFVKSWVISSWPYPAKNSRTAMWRGLEVSFRGKVWEKVFFELWNTEQISPATQLLILSSLPHHAHYARNFHAQGNWLTMEMSGLAVVATAWPEWKESPSWLDYSIKAMTASMKEQVYPDGTQTELSSSYHYVALLNFNQFAETCQKAGVVLSEYYNKTLQDMWNYLAMTIRPDGFGVLNNDSDLNNNRQNILEAAQKYGRSDWRYVVSNGARGTKPTATPSVFFPWAGQLISRSGYGEKAHWSFLDVGPWGSGHQHNDKLHLSVVAYGRDLLVDAGRFAYTGSVAQKFRKYALGSQGHNLVVVDGKGQDAGPKVTTEPTPENHFFVGKDHDYGSGKMSAFAGLEGTFEHTRSVVYLRDKFWVVADHLKTDRPRTIETLWHWHPDCRVEIDANGNMFTQNDYGNLQIIPVGSQGWQMTLVKGQENPTIQGWYSRVYNAYVPNPTGIYSRKLPADDTFVWILWPSEGKGPKLQTSILSKTNDHVMVKVTEAGKGSWVVRVPFLDRKGVVIKSEKE